MSGGQLLDSGDGFQHPLLLQAALEVAYVRGDVLRLVGLVQVMIEPHFGHALVGRGAQTVEDELGLVPFARLESVTSRKIQFEEDLHCSEGSLALRAVMRWRNREGCARW